MRYDDLEMAQMNLIHLQSVLNNDDIFKASEATNKSLNVAINLISERFAQKDAVDKSYEMGFEDGIDALLGKLITYCYQNGEEDKIIVYRNIRNNL